MDSYQSVTFFAASVCLYNLYAHSRIENRALSMVSATLDVHIVSPATMHGPLSLGAQAGRLLPLGNWQCISETDISGMSARFHLTPYF